MTDPTNCLKTVSGHDVLYVMATDQEYGAALKSRFTPFRTGVGPVEAGVGLGIALATLRQGGSLPDLVVSLGSAGSRTLEQGDIYQIESVSYRDMDASALGFPKGRTPFLDLPATLPLPLRIPDFPAARLSTGGNIVSGSAYDDVEADLVDMETFAHLRAAMHFSVPLIGLRGVSDGAEELRHFDDWTRLLPVLDEKLAGAVDRLEQAIGNGLLTQPPTGR
ncbi:5'-methylthioadenosine/S-adenosylhomocysteine nucleosidase [Notoacmeibacter marinus]|uniref:5'-methylthioadenosine/S-adenosylhomocysteine nucleosidase n=1 Tax=Notoacmeibacter marinus TaxID=1876515 RepID=UPI00247899F6|nr:5'-methylthioadenosine/S-adenosylhomocysteine nucleosidase [Notoacmeibacter marinus]